MERGSGGQAGRPGRPWAKAPGADILVNRQPETIRAWGHPSGNSGIGGDWDQPLLSPMSWGPPTNHSKTKQMKNIEEKRNSRWNKIFLTLGFSSLMWRNTGYISCNHFYWISPSVQGVGGKNSAYREASPRVSAFGHLTCLAPGAWPGSWIGVGRQGTDPLLRDLPSSALSAFLLCSHNGVWNDPACRVVRSASDWSHFLPDLSFTA